MKKFGGNVKIVRIPINLKSVTEQDQIKDKEIVLNAKIKNC